jgi:acyl-CoA reductase-like NAD-dependent aldehyde dehydrogenase
MNAQLQSIDPATGDVVGTVDVTPTSAIADVVARARAAHVGWNARSLDERLALMRKASARLAERASDIGLLGTREMGKPLREMAGEAAGVADLLLSDLDEMATAFADDVQENERSRTTVYRDGFGVAACISPWNFPVLMPHTQIIPALAAGNAVVFKPSERSPLTGAAYAQCLMYCRRTSCRLSRVTESKGERWSSRTSTSLSSPVRGPLAYTFSRRQVAR